MDPLQDTLRAGRLDWAVAAPWVAVFGILAILDVLTGLVAAFVAKQVNSTASFKGMAKKMTMVLVIATFAVLDALFPGPVLAQIAAAAFIFVEALSIVENAGRLGVPIPKALMDALSKLKDQEEVKTVRIAVDQPPLRVKAEPRSHDEPLPVQVMNPTSDPVHTKDQGQA